MKKLLAAVVLIAVGAAGAAFYLENEEEIDEFLRDLRGDSDPAAATPAEPASPRDLADLAITFATVERVADQSCFGNEICLIVTVVNRGTAGATGFTDGCGTSSFGDEEPWGSYVTDGIIPAGSSITYRSGYGALEEHLPATFTLLCEVDAADRVDESDETNNVYTATVSL